MTPAPAIVNKRVAASRCQLARKASRAAKAPALIVMPMTMKDAFMSACHGEQMATDDVAGWAPQAVFPRSLMFLTERWNGTANALATTTWAMKNCTATIHSNDAVREAFP